MEMIHVNSSAIRAIGYDPTTSRMNIAFEQGETYSFCKVPAHVFEDFLNARSKGTYYNDHIRDHYQC